jgi:cytochrome b561
MQAAFAHVLMLVFAAAIARLGWFITRNSEQASRFFTLGAEPVFGKRFAVIWTKAIGGCSQLSGVLGLRSTPC